MKKGCLIFFIAVTSGVIFLIRTSGSGMTKTVTTDTTVKSQGVTRIISLCKHPVPIIILGLDASDRRLVGVNPGAQLSMQSNVLNNYFPRFQEISGNVCTAGFAPNIEEMMKLDPDLVLDWSRFSEAIAQMQSFGFHVVGVDYNGSDENDRDMVYIVAKAIGREKMADSIMQWRDEEMHRIRTVSDGISPDKRPKVIFFYNYETLRVGGEQCYENFCINLAGGRNMGDGLGIDRSVNIEQILEWDPDIIFFGGWMSKLTPEDIYQNPFFADLSAVRNRRVFKMPIWASNELVLIWKWMAQIIQPGLFDYQLREEIRASYAWQYKIRLTENDIDQVLFCRENAGSPLYKNFKSRQ